MSNNNHVSRNHTTNQSLTVKDYLKDYTLIKESLEILTANGFIGEELFTQGYNAQGGGIKYLVSNGQFVDRDANPEDFSVDEGSEPHQVYVSEQAPAFATVKKHYIEGWVTYEEERRNQLGALARVTQRMTNTMLRDQNSRVMSLLQNHPGGTGANQVNAYTAGGAWSNVAYTGLYDDIIEASALVENGGTNGLSYNPNTLVVSNNTFTKMLRNASIKELYKAINRAEDSPYYTGVMGTIAGLTIMKSQYMTDSFAYILEKGAIGGIADEEPFTVKPVEDDTRRELFFIRMKRTWTAFISDPKAMTRITI